MEFFFAVAIRAGLGFILGIILGMAGIFFVFWVTPQVWVPPMWLLVIAAGASSSIAGFLGFLKPEAAWKVIWTTLIVAFASGMAGAWFGFWYAGEFYPEGVRNPALAARSLRSPAIAPFFLFAAVFTSFFGSIYYSVRFWRYHEV